MEVAGAQNGGENENYADTGVESRAKDEVENGLAQGAGEGQDVADEIKLSDLGALGQQTANTAQHGVDANIEPAPDGIFGIVLPSLEAVAMGEVVGRFVVVEVLVAVLDRGEES